MRRPSPGRILGRARERLRGARLPRGERLRRRLPPGPRLRTVREWLARPAAWLGRGWRAARRGAGAAWAGLPPVTRRRLIAALGAGALALVLLAFAVPNLPCQLPGGEECPPADDAEELVPADALAYVHVNLDPDTQQYERAREIAAAVPVFAQQIAVRALAQVPGPGGAPPDFERDIRPWFGGEAALAVVPGRGEGFSQVQLFEVADDEGAARFAREVGARRPETEEHRGVELRVHRRGLATAHVGGFLAIGPPEAVRAAIEAESGEDGAESLADADPAREAREELPDHRLAEAYLSEQGAERLVAGAGGTLSTLTPLLAPGATRGAAVALAASDDDELELSVRSVLDPERWEARPGFFAAFPPFDPELAGALPEQSFAYLGIGDPARTIRALLAQASAQEPGIAAGFEGLARSLRRRGEIDIERQLLPALGGEAAFALVPGRARGGAEAPALPYLSFVADDVDEGRARRALAGLQGPIAEAIDPAADLQAPVFGEREVAGVEARTLRVSPVVELAYAVFEGRAVVATDPLAIERLAEGEDGLDGADDFERATDDLADDDEVGLLGFFDLDELVALGERLGLSEDPVYAAFAPEFRRLGSLGFAVRADSELLASDARLVLAEAEDEDPALELPGPPAD